MTLTDLEEALNHSRTRLKYIAENLESLSYSFEETGNTKIAKKLEHEASLIFETVSYLENKWSEYLQNQSDLQNSAMNTLFKNAFQA